MVFVFERRFIPVEPFRIVSWRLRSVTHSGGPGVPDSVVKMRSIHLLISNFLLYKYVGIDYKNSSDFKIFGPETVLLSLVLWCLARAP